MIKRIKLVKQSPRSLKSLIFNKKFFFVSFFLKTAISVFIFVYFGQIEIVRSYLKEYEPHLKKFSVVQKLDDYFQIQEISVSNISNASEEMLQEKLSKYAYKNLFLLSADEIQNDLNEVPWVKKIVLQKKYPNKVHVKLVERIPFAKWQFQQQLYLVDEKGQILKRTDVNEFGDLIIFSGENARFHISEMINQLQYFPDIFNDMISAAWVGDRRWDIYLNNGIEIKLPEKNYFESLQRISKLNEQYDLFSRQITVFDARVPQKFVVQQEKSPIQMPNADQNKPIKDESA